MDKYCVTWQCFHFKEPVHELFDSKLDAERYVIDLIHGLPGHYNIVFPTVTKCEHQFKEI